MLNKISYINILNKFKSNIHKSGSNINNNSSNKLNNWKNSWAFSINENKVLILGFNLFLLTEVLIFILLFWSWFHASMTPTIWIGNVWPTNGLIAPKWWGIALYNTLILFISSCYITWAELSLKLRQNQVETLTALFLGIQASLHFLVCQYIEFSRLPFCYRDSIYGTIFYSTTGLHLLHVMAGTILLFFTTYKIKNYYIKNIKLL
jgi:cytochrome c oxidase subunit 3